MHKKELLSYTYCSQIVQKLQLSLKYVGFLDFTAASLHTYPDNAFYIIKSNFLYSYLAASSYNPKPDVDVLTISDQIKVSLWVLSPFTCFQTSKKNGCLATAGFALITSQENKKSHPCRVPELESL